MWRHLKPTAAIILLEILIYLILSLEFFPAIQYLGFSLTAFEHGSFWTPLSSLFVHVNIFHLGINMLFLYVFGTAVEEGVPGGARKVPLLFFIGGVASLFLGVPLYPLNTTVVGSSIAVSTVIGAVLAAIPMRRSPFFLFHAPLGLVATVYLIFNAFMTLAVPDSAGGVAYPSHVIGFVVGIAISLIWRAARQPKVAAYHP